MLRGIERLFRSTFQIIKQVHQLIVLVEVYPLKWGSNHIVTELILIESTVLGTRVAILNISSKTIKPITVVVTPPILILRLNPMRNYKTLIFKVKIAPIARERKKKRKKSRLPKILMYFLKNPHLTSMHHLIPS
jgi:hypothetical protein